MPLPVDSRPVIVTFGDSLTAGVVERTYPAYLQNILNQNGYAYHVDNQGVSGDTTTDGLARIDNVIAAHPALVLLEFGGNDGLRGIPVEETQKNLAAMIERLQQAKIPVILLGITLPPNYGADYVGPFTAIFPTLAKQYKIKLMPFLLIHVYRKRRHDATRWHSSKWRWEQDCRAGCFRLNSASDQERIDRTCPTMSAKDKARFGRRSPGQSAESGIEKQITKPLPTKQE